jgi:excisionase family DNA binding protein
MGETVSTSEAARRLGVAVGSVINWIDRGQLRAGRTPGGHRRIALDDLIEFAREHGLSVSGEPVPARPRVLIVDDEPAFANWLADEIRQKQCDYEVLEAHSGFAAGQVVGSLKPEVVLLDLRMPGMDGFEVCRLIRSNPDTEDTVVIAMTAYPSPEAERDVLACGAKLCLTKPLDPAVVLREVAAAVRRRR